MMNPIVWLILTLIDVYIWIVVAMVIMSWLVAFNIINTSNNFVRQVYYMIRQLTEPLLGPIRRFMPHLGGIDISPLILLIGLWFLKYLVIYAYYQLT